MLSQKEYQLLFKQDNIKLKYDENALKEIAKIAIEKKTGARGLRNILEDIMLDVMYDIPNKKTVITRKRQPLLFWLNIHKSLGKYLPGLF